MSEYTAIVNVDADGFADVDWGDDNPPADLRKDAETAVDPSAGGLINPDSRVRVTVGANPKRLEVKPLGGDQ